MRRAVTYFLILTLSAATLAASRDLGEFRPPYFGCLAMNVREPTLPPIEERLASATAVFTITDYERAERGLAIATVSEVHKGDVEENQYFLSNGICVKSTRGEGIYVSDTELEDVNNWKGSTSYGVQFFRATSENKQALID